MNHMINSFIRQFTADWSVDIIRNPIRQTFLNIRRGLPQILTIKALVSLLRTPKSIQKITTCYIINDI